MVGGTTDGGIDAFVDVTCASPQTACGGQCVDTAADPSNCGACGNACAAGLVCANGACALECGPSLATCQPSGDAGLDGGGNAINTDACTNACRFGTVILGGNQITYITQALSSLGETVTTNMTEWLPASGGGVLIMSRDGGTSTPVDYNAFLNAGGHALMIGGSNVQSFYEWARGYFSHTGNVSAPGWTTLSCTPHTTLSGTHPITRFLPATYTFPVANASYHMIRFSASQPTGVATLANSCDTGDRGAIVVRRYSSGGTMTYLAFDVGNYGSTQTVNEYVAPFLRGYFAFVRGVH